MAKRVCRKCGSDQVKVTRSKVRQTASCQACGHNDVKRIIAKGFG